MKTEKVAAKTAKTHTVYKNSKGDRVPGVTTILGVMDKPALVKWANNLGLQGIDSSKYVDALARIGSLAHYIIECYLKKETVDYSDYTENEIKTAENSVLKFFNWLESNQFEVIASELILVSDHYGYGGTVDCICKLNGKITLLDFKTCKGCYTEHHTQAVAYKILAVEHGYLIDDIKILRIGRDENEGFDEITVGKEESHTKRFLLCKDLYEVNKEINRK
jgi:hypothetical protein